MHKRFTELMSLQLDGVASSAQQLELRRHLDRCAECAKVWRQWQEIDQRLSTALEMPAPLDLAPDLSVPRE